MKDYHTIRIWCIGSHISLGSLILGYELGILNPSYDEICRVLNIDRSSDLYLALFSSILPLGGAIGALISGRIANKLGRRKTTMLANVLSIIASLLAMISYPLMFIVSRFVEGIACGSYAAICPIYLGEYSPPGVRGKLGSLTQMNLTVGLMVVYCLGLLLPVGPSGDFFRYWWRVMFLLPGLISCYMLLTFLFVFTHDTPYWLGITGSTVESHESLRYIYTQIGIVKARESLSSDILEADAKKENQRVSYKNLFCSKRYSKMMRLGCFLNLAKQFCGNGPILFYSAYILNKGGGDVFTSRLYSLIIGMFNFLFAIVSMYIVGKFGRKSLIILGELGMCIDLALLGILPMLTDDTFYPFVIGLSIFMAMFQISLGSILWVYCSEIMNDRALGFANSVTMLGNFVVVLIFPIAQEAIGIYGVFLFFSACMLLAAIYCYFDMFETKYMSRVEITRRVEDIHPSHGESLLLSDGSE